MTDGVHGPELVDDTDDAADVEAELDDPTLVLEPLDELAAIDEPEPPLPSGGSTLPAHAISVEKNAIPNPIT